MLKKTFFITLGVIGLGVVAGMVVLWWLVVINPGEAVRQDNIQKILSVESPVYYSDGRNRIGVFFEGAHRQYIPYAQIPKDFINAIVAAEDRDFFEHHGIDFGGLIRAMIVNIRAGRVVQGGSTITQQTAKNLFKRKDRSLRAKLKELLFALRLEYHFPKEKILEFYVNQFYVSGNGRGLGVAAQYFFDKPAQKLNTLECAFIAGSVKKPNYYNPFIQKDEEAVVKAKTAAKSRAGYVLDQMYKIGMIDVDHYQKLLIHKIPFKEGQMQYSSNTIMDLVKTAMSDQEVEEALVLHGIENIATSGIQVITTVDKDLQESSLYGLRKELSRLDVRLQGYKRDSVREVYSELPFGSEKELQINGFLIGRIVALDRSASPSVTVTFGRDDAEEVIGRIDKAGLMNLLVPLMKHEKQRWTEAQESNLPILLERLKKRDLVYVSVREIDSTTGDLILDLEKYPELQGAALVLQNGVIRAMVGGMENHFYNRAITARRPLGSVFKPLVYTAALQLGWNSLDILHNERNVFVYQNKPYFPRPDHQSPYRKVSMNWAGVHSENVATVWLLYHLCDRLAPAQFKELVVHLDLAQRPLESYQDYVIRIRDELGVVVDADAIGRAAFAKAVVAIEPDLLFAGKQKEYEALQSLRYDTGLDESPNNNDLSKTEITVRETIRNRNFLKFKEFYKELQWLQEMAPAFEKQRLTTTLFYNRKEGRFLFRNRQTDTFVYGRQPPGDGWKDVSLPELKLLLSRMRDKEQQDFWDSILIEGMLTPSTVKQLSATIDKEHGRMTYLPSYDPEVLHQIRDFRVLVALRYLVGLCRELGIESELDPVLSFPLGSNVVSLLEAARAYEGMVKGKVVLNAGVHAATGLNIIDRIVDSDGDLIYSPKRNVKRIVDPKTSLAVSDILRNAIKFGTGRYAARNIRLHSRNPEKEKQLAELDLRLPMLGKTGTANRFTNAAFVGIIPTLIPGNAVSLENGYILASYVGFDDNRPMMRNSTHITGATGALPLWTRMANAILLGKNYADSLNLVDFAFSGVSEIPLRFPALGQIEVNVNVNSGVVSREATKIESAAASSNEATILTFGEIDEEGDINSARYFLPYWQISGNFREKEKTKN